MLDINQEQSWLQKGFQAYIYRHQTCGIWLQIIYNIEKDHQKSQGYKNDSYQVGQIAYYGKNTSVNKINYAMQL